MNALRSILSPAEKKLLQKLNTPIKIQNYLDTVPRNWEKQGQTYMSPRRALRENKMHCLEAALFAGLALWYHGEEPLVVDLKARGDDDHIIALYRKNGFWGAMSKTNYATVRFRDPIFRTVRELVLSYFHEYFLNTNGKKVLYSYSAPYNLKRFGTQWITAEEDLHDIAITLDELQHTVIVPTRNRRFIRPADAMERAAGKLTEWKKTDPRT